MKQEKKKMRKITVTLVILTGLFGSYSQGESTMPSVTDIPLVNVKIAGSNPSPDEYARYCRTIVSPTVNTPESFQGYGGWNGWAAAARLQNGDILVAFCAGYAHASYATPIRYSRETLKKMKHRDWTLDWDCPTGGIIHWIRSKDNGKTWSKPKPFPIIRTCYHAGKMIQLKGGTILVTGRTQVPERNYYGLPNHPVSFVEGMLKGDAIPTQTVLFRSTDNGESWEVYNKWWGPFYLMDAPYGMIQDDDGALLMAQYGMPLPSDPKQGWFCQPGQKFAQCVNLLLRSTDEGRTWSIVSMIAHENFDINETGLGRLPDGSLAFCSRPTSAWFQSYDEGKTWSQPKRIMPGIGRGMEGSNYRELIIKPELVVTGDGIAVLLFAGHPNGTGGKTLGQVTYSRDSGKTWVRPALDQGFIYNPACYYPTAVVLPDNSIIAVGTHEGVKPNPWGPRGAELTTTRFRIKSAEEGEGIELLPFGP